MRKLLLGLLLLSAPVGAQVSQAKFDSLVERVNYLDSVVGTKKFQASQIPCSALEQSRPTANFPNGEYDLAFRNRQFGCAFDPVVVNSNHADSLASVHDIQINRQGLEIQDLKSQIAGLSQQMPVATDGGNLFIPGTLTVGTRVCIGRPCYPDAASQLQIQGDGDADIMVVSNLNGQQWQNPAKHVGMWSLSGDGGMRIIHNGFVSISTYSAYDPVGMVNYQSSLRKFIDPTRAYAAYGTDSRGRFSFLLNDPNVSYDYTQNLILNFDAPSKQIQFQSMQSGWTFQFLSSVLARDLTKSYVIPQ